MVYSSTNEPMQENTLYMSASLRPSTYPSPSLSKKISPSLFTNIHLRNRFDMDVLKDS